MNDDEFFVDALNKMVQLFKQDPELIKYFQIDFESYAEDTEGVDDDEADEIRAKIKEFEDGKKDIVSCLDRLIPQIHEIDDVYSFDIIDFAVILESLELYSEVFVIDGRSVDKLIKSEEEFIRLNNILALFWVDEDDCEDGEEE